MQYRWSVAAASGNPQIRFRSTPAPSGKSSCTGAIYSWPSASARVPYRVQFFRGGTAKGSYLHFATFEEAVRAARAQCLLHEVEGSKLWWKQQNVATTEADWQRTLQPTEP